MKSDLPPGVSASDIPGNTKQDEEWEGLYDFLCSTGLEPWEIRCYVDMGATFARHLTISRKLAERDDHQHDWVEVFCEGREEPVGWVCIHCGDVTSELEMERPHQPGCLDAPECRHIWQTNPLVPFKWCRKCEQTVKLNG